MCYNGLRSRQDTSQNRRYDMEKYGDLANEECLYKECKDCPHWVNAECDMELDTTEIEE